MGDVDELGNGRHRSSGGLVQDLVEARWNDSAFRNRGIIPRTATAWLEEQVAALKERA
jgi:hypothetical protein